MTNYTPIVFQNDQAPAINASSLNYMQAGVESAHTELASQAVQIASTIGYASDIAGNLGANASAIAVHTSVLASHGAALATLGAVDAVLATAIAAQAGAVASSTAAVASAMPLLASVGTTLGIQSSQIAALATTVAPLPTQVGIHSTQIADLTIAQASQAAEFAALAPQLATLDSVATTLGIHSTQIAQLSGLTPAHGYGNRSGRGPVDLWTADPDIFVTPTAGNARALAGAVVPNVDWPVTTFTLELARNGSATTALGNFSVGILDETGDLVAYSTPTQVPSIGTAVAAATIVVPNAVPSVLLAAGSRYFFVIASNEADRLLPVGQQFAYSAAPGIWNRGLAYAWDLASGVDLNLYGGLPLDVASSLPPDGVAAIFV